MIILCLQGGLGNQLFQYALYLELTHRGHTVLIDDKSGYEGDLLRHPVLTEIFELPYTRATDREIRQMRDAFMDPVHRVKRKLFGRRNREWQEPDARFYPEVLSMEDVYLNGYFQSAQYFPTPEVQRQLRTSLAGEEIREKILSAADAAAIDEQIAADAERSVSLHIRRGDYLTPGPRETHGGICTEQYYDQAVRTVLNKCPEAVFYIFSDDAPFAEDFAGRQTAQIRIAGSGDTDDSRSSTCRFIPVRLTAGPSSMRDAAELLLMARCRHHILANSSFSWWGTWLAEKATDRLVTAPDRWFNNRADDGIYTQEMLRISG